MQRLVLATLLLGLAVPATASAAAAPMRTVEVPTGGFTIGLPTTWVNVTSAAPNVLKELEKVPAFKSFAQSATQNGSLKLIAADPTTNGSAYMDTGVARVGQVPLSTVAAATVKALKQTLGPKGSVVPKKVQLPVGPAYVIHLARKGSPNETDEYIFLRDQVEYVIVYVATAKSWSKYEPLFTRSAQSFRITPGPDLSHVVLAPTQVGSGYKLTQFPFGNSFIGQATLDLCGATYASETLRTGRLQVRYQHPGKAVSVSNEVVTYAAGGAQQALDEVAGVARSCAQKPVVRSAGAVSESYRVSPLSDPKLPKGSVVVKLTISASDGKKHVTQTGVAVYQVKGNTLSGVYAFVGKGTTFADARRIAYHAAEQSTRNLGGKAAGGGFTA
jgi:hypothetical protein